MQQAAGAVDQTRRKQKTASRNQVAMRAIAADDLSFNGTVRAAHV